MEVLYYVSCQNKWRSTPKKSQCRAIFITKQHNTEAYRLHEHPGGRSVGGKRSSWCKCICTSVSLTSTTKGASGGGKQKMAAKSAKSFGPFNLLTTPPRSISHSICIQHRDWSRTLVSLAYHKEWKQGETVSLAQLKIHLPTTANIVIVSTRGNMFPHSDAEKRWVRNAVYHFKHQNPLSPLSLPVTRGALTPLALMSLPATQHVRETTDTRTNTHKHRGMQRHTDIKFSPSILFLPLIRGRVTVAAG